MAGTMPNSTTSVLYVSKPEMTVLQGYPARFLIRIKASGS